MKLRFLPFAVVMTLTYPTLAWANMAVYYYENDPGYAQLAMRHGMISFSLWTAVMLGLVWTARRRREHLVPVLFTSCAALAVFIYFLGEINVNWMAGSEFLTSTNGELDKVQFSFRRNFKPDSAKHQTFSPPMMGFILAATFTFAGLCMVRYYQAKQGQQCLTNGVEASTPNPFECTE